MPASDVDDVAGSGLEPVRSGGQCQSTGYFSGRNTVDKRWGTGTLAFSLRSPTFNDTTEVLC